MSQKEASQCKWKFVGQLVVVAAVFLMAVPQWIAASEAATYTVNPSRDSRLNEGKTGENKGTDTEIDLTSSKVGDNRRVPIYGFTLPTVASGETIVSASLKLWVRTAQNKVAAVHRVTDTWTEATVTWANTGTDFNATSEATFTPSTASAYVTIDITSLVEGWYSGSYANNGLVILPSSTDTNVRFTSREWATAAQRPELVITTVAVQPVITMVKSTTLISDPINGSTNPKMIPDAVVRYTVNVSNSSTVTADSGTTMIVDAIPTNMRLFVGDIAGAGSGPVAFANGTTASGLTYSFTSLANGSDSLSFSNDGGANFTYTPVPDGNGYDAGVTHVRVNPSGSFAAKTGPTDPSFSLQLRMQVK